MSITDNGQRVGWRGGMLSRRGFIKSVAASGTAMALAGGVGCLGSEALASPSGQVAPEEHEFVGACRGNCASSCTIKATVRDGKIVKTEAYDTKNPLDRRMCVKGHTWPQRIYLPERLKYPMRRAEGTKRGEGKWEQITWDEAIDEIATKWLGYVENYGPTSVAQVRGDGNLGMANTFYKVLFGTMGAAEVHFSCDHSITHFAGPKIIGYDPWFFGNDPKTMTLSDNVFIWGANTSTSAQTSWPYIQEAIDAGAHLICIDPQYTVLASKSDEWFSIRPGTDAALTMAMINVIVEEGLQDERTISLLKTDTVGPWLVKEDGTYLRPSDLGQPVTDPKKNIALCMGADGNMGSNFVDGFDPVLEGTFDLGGMKVKTAYTLLLERCAEMPLDKAAEITGISEDDIRYLARKYCEGKTANMSNTGIDHHTNGGPAYMGLFDLMMVAGAFGEPGRGQYGGNATNISMGWTASSWAGAANAMSIFSPYFCKAVREKSWKGQPFDPKMLFVSEANIFDIFTGEQEWRDVFDQMEYIALVDVVMTETAKHADIVLPAAEYFERWDLSYTVNPYMAINEKAIDPPYECKDDFEIANLLAKALGHEEIVTTIDDFMSEKLNTPLCQKAGVTWEKLKEMKTVYTAVDDYYLGVQKPYMSPTGKLNLYFEKIQPLNDYGQIESGELDQEKYSMVTFEPMEEAWNESLGGYPQSEHSKTYPINLMSWRSRFRTHTMFSTVPVLLEMQEDPCIYMNPEDMAERGIVEGDKVRAFNDRGYVIIRAAEHPGVRKKTAMVEHGWQKDQYIEGSYQSLIGAHTHPLTNQEAWFDVTIEIEKA